MHTVKAKLNGIVLVIGLSAGIPVYATTIPAADCDQSIVQAAIDAAVTGDTVTVPAGDCNWDDVSIPDSK